MFIIIVAESLRVSKYKSSTYSIKTAPKVKAKAVADGIFLKFLLCMTKKLWLCLFEGKVNFFQEKVTKYKTVPQTDTGRLVEYTKARERTKFKELGKMTS